MERQVEMDRKEKTKREGSDEGGEKTQVQAKEPGQTAKSKK